MTAPKPECELTGHWTVVAMVLDERPGGTEAVRVTLRWHKSAGWSDYDTGRDSFIDMTIEDSRKLVIGQSVRIVLR